METYVGTDQTETVIGSAASKMQQSLKAYEQAQQQLQKLPEFLNEYTLKIAQAGMTLLLEKAEELGMTEAEFLTMIIKMAVVSGKQN